jgi:spore germination protein GerM
MNRTLFHTALLALLSTCGSATVTATAAPQQTVKIYLVAVGDAGKVGRKFGCDDSLVPVAQSVQTTKSPLTAAINKLLATPRQLPTNAKLSNYWFGPDLKLKSVSVRDGLATIRFSGHVTVAGVCDQPRIKEQIEATARQFPNVKRVKVFVGQETLDEAIS